MKLLCLKPRRHIKFFKFNQSFIIFFFVLQITVRLSRWQPCLIMTLSLQCSSGIMISIRSVLYWCNIKLIWICWGILKECNCYAFDAKCCLEKSWACLLKIKYHTIAPLWKKLHKFCAQGIMIFPNDFPWM